MKNFYKYILLITGFCCVNTNSYSQGVNTLYFLENAPMRHIINPAFQPVSNLYISLPIIGYTNINIGNNALTLQDLVFTDANGKTITALHPDAEGELWNKLPQLININTNLNLNLLSFGARVAKDKGYFHINVSEHIDANLGIPKYTFGPLLGQSLNDLNLNSLNLSASIYTEIALGYSHRINTNWTVGGKLKLLLGHALMDGKFDELNLKSNTESTRLYGDGNFLVGGILNTNILNSLVQGTSLPDNYIQDQLIEDLKTLNLGCAIDLGVTYTPIKYLQISASVTDLGFIHWKKGEQVKIEMDTTFIGLDDMKYDNYIDQNGEFQSDLFINDASNQLLGYLDALHIQAPTHKPFNRLLTAKINLGIDANIWKNRIGLGVYSRTHIHDTHVSEEITLGAAFRPIRCLHLAASYSFFNGRGSNIGAAISVAPYDGVMLTAIADYIPLSFAEHLVNEQSILIPYNTGNINIALGIAIVIGTSKKINK